MRPHSVRAKVVVTLSIVSALFASSASGDEAARRDRDEPGSQMKLDVARTTHDHKKQDRTRLLLHEVRFQDDVDSQDFYSGLGGLQLLFDIDDDRAEERAIRFILNPDGSVAAQMYKPGPKVLGYANWWRPDARTVKIAFPRSLLGKRVNRYRWRVLAAQNAPCEPNEPGGITAHGCIDKTRRLVHELRR